MRQYLVTSCTIFFCVVSFPHSFQSAHFSHFQRSSPQFDRLVFQPLSQFRSFLVILFQFSVPKSIRFSAFRQFEVLPFWIFPLFLGFKSPTFSRALKVISCTPQHFLRVDSFKYAFKSSVVENKFRPLTRSAQLGLNSVSYYSQFRAL